MALEGGKAVDVGRVSAEQAKSIPLKEAIQVDDVKKTGLTDKLLVDQKTADALEKAMDRGISLKVTDSTPPVLVFMFHNNIEIPSDFVKKTPLTVNVTGNDKWQEDLFAAAEKAVLAVNRPRFYHDLERTEASDQVSLSLTEADKPGKIHEEFEADVKKIDEKTASLDFGILSGKPSEGAEKAEPVTVEDIRYNTRLLNKPKDTEKPEEEVKNLKDETARRMKAYTSSTGDGWFKVDYAKFGNDKRGMSHELYVGLGDILLDLDIQNILVERDGQILKAHRGEVMDGQHKGRIGFLDESGKYVATHTGDRFRIVSGDKMDVAQYSAKYKEERTKRETGRTTFKTSTTDLYVAEKDFSIKEGISLKTDYKTPDGKDASVEITNAVIEGAAAECAKSSPIEKAAAKRQNLMKCLNYIAAKIGVPPSAMLAIIYHECGIKFPANVGDGGLAVGMGQIHPEGWGTVKKDPRFSELVGPVMKEVPGEAGRNKNIFVDLVGVAIFMKKGIERFGFKIDNTTPMEYLTEETVTAPDGVGMSRMAWIRTFYHVPSYAGQYAKAIASGSMDKVSGKAQAWIKENMSRYIKLSDNIAIAMKSMKAAGTDGGTMMA